MGANWDFTVTTNVFGNAQGVRAQDFGTPVWATEDVEAGFTELYRAYESNSAIQLDDDLSAPAKAAGAIFFSQPAELRPQQLIIAPVTYASLGTDLDVLLAAFKGFYGVACQDRTKATQVLLAAWTLANERLGSLQSLDSDILAGTAGNLFETVSDLANGRAFGSWHATDTEYADLAWLAQILGPNADVTASVAYDKTLVGVASQNVTVAQRDTVTGYGGNLYLTLKGVGATGEGTLFDGDWIDELITEDLFKARSEEGIAQLRLDTSQRGSKIPYDNDGLAQIEQKIRDVYLKLVGANHLRAGSLVMNVPDISAVDSADIAARQTTLSATVISKGAQKDITLNVGILNGAA